MSESERQMRQRRRTDESDSGQRGHTGEPHQKGADLIDTGLTEFEKQTQQDKSASTDGTGIDQEGHTLGNVKSSTSIK